MFSENIGIEYLVSRQLDFTDLDKEENTHYEQGKINGI